MKKKTEEKRHKIVHFMYCPMTGLGDPGYRGHTWLRHRLEIFKRFVVPSLMGQKNREFILWMSFRPEDRDNRIVQEFRDSLEGLRGLSYVFTFGGLCFYDDKFDRPTAEVRLLNSLHRTLPELKTFVGDADWVYMTIQPSDDCYALDAVRLIQEVEPGHKSIGFTKGYICDYGTKRVCEYDPDTLPPFSTIVFPSKTFLDPTSHFKYTGPYVSHEYVGDHLRMQVIPGRKFLVGTHGENISTTFNHPYRGKEIEEAWKTWIEFGIYASDPISYAGRPHILLRTIVNCLPRSFHPFLKKIYYKLKK